VTLLAPALLLGLVALTLPVIAHLMGHREPQRVQFAGVRFLEPVERVVTRRRAPRDIDLLVARLLLLALLVLLLARPASVGQTSVAVIAEPHDAVVVVDGSRSMGLEVEGASLLVHAGDRIEALLDALPSGSRIGLVTSDPGGPRVELGDDPERARAALRDWIERGAPRPGAWTLADALPLAASLLSSTAGEERKRVIYAFGDRTERGLGSLPETAEGGIPILAIPALEDANLPEHVSLDEVAWEQAPDIDPRAVRIQAVLRRHGGTDDGERTKRPVSVALLVGGEEVARTVVQVEPDTDVQVEFTHQLLDGGTTFPATVQLVDLEDDPLPSDDRRHLWLSPDDALEVIVTNGDPSELRAHDEVFFLGTALAASESGKTMHITSLAPDQLEQRIREQGALALGDVDVLVLANVRAPQEDVAPAIVDFVKRGAGLLITVGGRVEAEPYNARLGAVLPLMMREPVVVGTAPGRKAARVEGIAPPDLSHPLFAGLEGDPGLSGTRARKIFLLDPDADRAAEIAISFTSGAPALVTRDADLGRVALLTTTVDRDWADLPLRPGFVPLMEHTIAYLAGARARALGTTVMVGQPRTVEADAPLEVETPSGRKISIAPDRNGLAVLSDTYEVGHHRVLRADGSLARTGLFAVQVDPAESLTRPMPLTQRELEGEQKDVSTLTPRWRSLVPLVLVLLIAEVALRWRRRRG